MAPKQDRAYACGRSKSVAPSTCLVIGSDVERDPKYVPPGTSNPYRASHATRATPTKVASGVVTSSQSDEERTLAGTPSGSATTKEGASVSLGVSWSEEASGSPKVPTIATPVASASSDEAKSSESTSGSPAQAPTPATEIKARKAETSKRPCTFQIDRRAAPAKQAPLEQVRLRGVQVDISLPSIRRFLYGEGVDATQTPLTVEFDYRWQILKMSSSCAIHR